VVDSGTLQGLKAGHSAKGGQQTRARPVTMHGPPYAGLTLHCELKTELPNRCIVIEFNCESQSASLKGGGALSLLQTKPLVEYSSLR
jgi:hypothetical protein